MIFGGIEHPRDLSAQHRTSSSLDLCLQLAASIFQIFLCFRRPTGYISAIEYLILLLLGPSKGFRRVACYTFDLACVSAWL